MTVNGWVQIAVFFAIVILITRPLGGYMTRVFAGERTFLSPLLRPLERTVYWCCGVEENEEQHWLTYAVAMLFFSIAGFASLYALQRLQWYLPFNPQDQTAVEPSLAFNTSVSFITNTNWQAYSGETTMGYLVQMAGLTVHNFVSAATGIAMAMALIRGFVRHQWNTVGNFWVDLTRCTLYILLPISIVGALALVWLGVPQNLGAYIDATTLEGAKQVIAQGPVASQEIIKEFGTNGGGFFNANSAHPFENPNAITNLIELVAIFAIGAALTNTLGRMVKDERQGWAIFAAMGLLFLAGVVVCYNSEAQANPFLAQFDVNSAHTALQQGGNMEGKEVRFGPALSSLWAVVTTDTSCGAVNSMHDSYLPLGGAVPMVNMMLGEVIFGGVGSGLYGILAFAIVAMFVAGLMVGRTPEYLGKKLEAKEVKMTILALLSLPLSILGWTALATVLSAGLAGIANGGPHGFSEILYAFVEGTANNGSAFAGLNANTWFYNLTIAGAMLIGRFIFVVPMLAVAGSLAQKKLLERSAGTFPTHSAQFVGLLVGVILIVGGLTYFPAVSLGPVTEQVAMDQGHLYPSP
jgi:potassium-transporting ATPase potassium-binding subunit